MPEIQKWFPHAERNDFSKVETTDWWRTEQEALAQARRWQCAEPAIKRIWTERDDMQERHHG